MPFKHYNTILQSGELNSNTTQEDLLEFLSRLNGRYYNYHYHYHCYYIYWYIVIIISRKLTSGELTQIFHIIRDNVGDYQEEFIKVLDHLLSSQISWFEFLSEERKIWNKSLCGFYQSSIRHYLFRSLLFQQYYFGNKNIDSIIFLLYVVPHTGFHFSL